VNPSTRTIVGAGIGVFFMVVFGEAVYHVASIGTCASGGPYQIGRTCPSGAGWWIAAVGGSIVGVVLASIVVESGVFFLIGGLFLAGGIGAVVALLDGSASASGSSLGLEIMLGVWGLLVLGWVAAVLGGRRKKRLTAALRDHGKTASAQLEQVEDTGITVNNNPRVRLTLRVRPEGQPEFEAHKTITVPRVAIPRIGQTFPVWYDPENQHKLVLELPDAASGDGAREAAPDGLDELKKLGELRDSGVLSESEFEAQKAKILADL
jgi:hypothetical protein